MPPPVVDGNARGREGGIGEGPDGDRDTHIFLAVLGMEEVRPADRAEAEGEPRALVAGANIFGRLAEDPIGRGEAGQGGEDAAGSPLAGQAMTDADAARLALNLDAQLAARTRGCALIHVELLSPVSNNNLR